MKLFEITTGYVGESYVRAYAWAADEREATALFRSANPDQDDNSIIVRELFDGSVAPFCTQSNDHGWPD